MSASQLVPPTQRNGFWYQSAAAEDSRLVYTGPGMLHTLFAVNANAAARYLWVFDGTSSSGTLIAGPFPVAPSGFVSIDARYGIPFTVGLFIGASSTLATYTAAGGTDHRFGVGYGKRAQL